MLETEKLRQMAGNYISLNGESFMNDPGTPSFVRLKLVCKSEADMPRAG